MKSDGTVWAWGANTYGQLGDGSTTNRNTPVQVLMPVDGRTLSFAEELLDGVIPDSGASQITLCASVYDSTGQEVIGAEIVYFLVAPHSGVSINSVTGVVTVNSAASPGTVAVKAAFVGQEVFAYIDLAYAGPNVYFDKSKYTLEVPGSGVARVTVSAKAYDERDVLIETADISFSLAVPYPGVTVNGPTGIVTVSPSANAGAVMLKATYEGAEDIVKLILTKPSPLKFEQVSAGGAHTLALAMDGTVWAWGSNQYGQLGDSTTTDRATPVKVKNLTGIVSIAAGNEHSIALKSDGTVWAWGRNTFGQLGDGTTTNRSSPVQVSSLTGVADIAAGVDYSLTVKSDGTVWGWGNNNDNQLGVTNSLLGPFLRSSPVQMSGSTNSKMAAGGDRHSLVLRNDGRVWATGNNSNGQLGDGTTTKRTTPVQLSNPINITAIAAGANHSLALKNDGTVWAWGLNTNGQLGDGTMTQRTSAVQVSGLTGVESVTAGAAYGSAFSVALKSDGTVWSWGLNSSGQLGDNSTVQRTSAVQASGLNDVTSVSAGGSHTVALRADGTVWAWGNNGSGQLGDGTKVNRNTAVACIAPFDGRNLYFDQIIYDADIPHANTADMTVSAGAYNAAGNAISNANISYSLVTPYPGVCIDASTGVVTVSASTLPGSVTIKAAYSGMENVAELRFVDTRSVVFAQNIYMAFIPDMNSTQVNMNASVLDGAGQAIPNTVITYALASPTAGVSIDPSTGIVTILPAARPGVIKINATHDGVTGMVGLVLTYAGSKVFFNESVYSIRIPEQNSASITVSASMYDADYIKIPDIAFTYSLAVTYPGVTVNTATGVITVDSTAQPGSVEVVATYGGVLATAMLLLGDVSGPSFTISATAGNDYRIAVQAISSSASVVYTVTYDPAEFQLVDACGLIIPKITVTGPVSGTDINILSISSGSIAFECTASVPSGMNLSGTVNIIVLKALKTANMTVTVSVS